MIGVISATFNAAAQLFFLPSYPLWSLAIFAVDILIIYGLIVYGGTRPSAAKLLIAMGNGTDEIGPVDCLIVAFASGQFEGNIGAALAQLMEEGTIRIMDMTFVTKDENGEIGGARADGSRSGGP